MADRLQETHRRGKKAVELDAGLVEGFVNRFLISSYQNSLPIESFHRDWWAHMCEDYPYNALAAPRGHSKSTSITLGFSFAGLMFRRFEYVLILSRSWGIAIEFLRTMKEHVLKNDELRQVFRIRGLTKDAEDDMIVQFEDGHQFRVVARGMEQSMRGLNWGSKRPDLVIGDDMEDDEAVLSKERREKQMDWFMSAVMPIGSDHCIFRIVGTVLHTDALLENFLNDPAWHSLRYEAHNDDFTEILWPRKFTKERLQAIRRTYVNQGRLDKYNMEYRNRPVDESAGLFRREDFIGISESDQLRRAKWRFMVGADYAYSKETKRDYTCFVVAGLDDGGMLYVVEVVRRRMDAKEILEEMFRIEETYRLASETGTPLQWYIEDGAVSRTLGYSLEQEMKARQVFLNLAPMKPGTTDKRQRSVPMQARMRAKAVKFDKDTSWFYDLQDEMISFDRGKHDDQVDAMSWIGMGLANSVLPASQEEEDYEEYLFNTRRQYRYGGRNQTTGY